MQPWQHEWGKSRYEDRVWAQVAGMRPALAADRLLLVLDLQAFFDESVDDTGVIAVAGYIASAGEWASFSHEWEPLLRPMGTLRTDGTYHFKMSEMAVSDERMSRVPAFHTVINKHVRATIGAVVDPDDIIKAMARIRSVPPSLLIWSDEAFSPYFMALRTALDSLQQLRLQRPDIVPPNEPIAVYFDENSEARLVREIWARYATNTHEIDNIVKLLRGPYFEKDDKFLPIQAADFRSWWLRKWIVERGSDELRRAFNAKENLFPFSTAAQGIYHSIVVPDEEYWVQTLKSWVEYNNPDKLIIVDAPELEEPEHYPSPDPPAPLSITSLKRLLGRVFRGRSF